MGEVKPVSALWARTLMGREVFEGKRRGAQFKWWPKEAAQVERVQMLRPDGRWAVRAAEPSRERRSPIAPRQMRD